MGPFLDQKKVTERSWRKDFQANPPHFSQACVEKKTCLNVLPLQIPKVTVPFFHSAEVRSSH